MSPPASALALPGGPRSALLGADLRPSPAWRARLRRIPAARNACSVASVWAQAALVVGAAVRLGHPAAYATAFLLMGRTHAQLLSLMHEAAHRLLLPSRRANDWVGRWLVGYPALTNVDGYRRVHMAHHREEFGPDEPDVPLYAHYPITRASLARKLLRDALGVTGLRMLRDQLRGLRSDVPVVRDTQRRILAVQAAMWGACALAGAWWVWPLLWLGPYLTVWRVINRLRSIAEHGGLRADPDRRATTHSVRQGPLARFGLVPYGIGWHMAHHLDPGVPFRALPRYHAELRASGAISDALEWPSYRACWRALCAG
ncbi:MAG: fatty acid desaturase family protein [Acidimicrobiia bacterium]